MTEAPDAPSGQPPEMGPATTKFAKIDPGPSQRFGVLSALLTLVGAVLLGLALTATDWFKGGGSHFGQVNDALESIGDLSTGVANAYFGWLGWMLAVAAVLTALLAAVPTVGAPLRWASPLLCVAAIAVTFLAIKLQHLSEPAYSQYLKNARLGFWFAVAGFALVGLGAAIGPRRR
jgi:hypothetical protein